MGAGKSTIGRLLAQELNCPFRDTDKEIVLRAGADIPWIFDVEGESGFRIRETQVIDELTQSQGQVLATGGGAIMNAHNRTHLSKRGHVVYLQTSVKQQLARTARDKQRPLLQQPNPEQILTQLMQVREPHYLEIAHTIINTDGRAPRSVVSEILQRVSPQTDQAPLNDQEN